MATPAQSINAIQGQTKRLSLKHEATFDNYTVKFLVGKRRADEELDLVAELPLDVDGELATGELLIDMAPGLYETQLIITNTEDAEDEEAVLGPRLVVKARIGGWQSSP